MIKFMFAVWHNFYVARTRVRPHRKWHEQLCFEIMVRFSVLFLHWLIFLYGNVCAFWRNTSIRALESFSHSNVLRTLAPSPWTPSAMLEAFARMQLCTHTWGKMDTDTTSPHMPDGGWGQVGSKRACGERCWVIRNGKLETSNGFGWIPCTWIRTCRRKNKHCVPQRFSKESKEGMSI